MSDTRCYRGHVITDPLEGICPHCEDGTVTLYPARQARTIRRLRALADGYRARLAELSTFVWGEYATEVAVKLSPGALLLAKRLREPVEFVGAAKERARIVAALRLRAECIRRIVKAMRAVPHPDYRQIEYDQARADGVMSAADAIERGEL